jgi:RsiW-degrading membrane proteinase PrsW (M82 family)
MITQDSGAEADQIKNKKHHAWWRVLLIGLLLYFVGLAVMVLSGNPILFPTVVMLGSFLVPITYVTFFYERRHFSRVNLPATAISFVYGGVLGVFASSLLEPIFITNLNFSSSFVIGFIEEFAKILGILVIARHHRHNSELDGLILGAAAGMGFAALESSGYTFTAFLRSGGSLSVSVGVTLLRGLLAPLGHGTWTAILAAVLFRESAPGHFRINLKVFSAYLTVVVLHGLWDGLPIIMSAFFSSGLDIFTGQSLVAGTGLFILWWRWREGVRLQAAMLQEEEAALETIPGQYVPMPYTPISDFSNEGDSVLGIDEERNTPVLEIMGEPYNQVPGPEDDEPEMN